MNKFLAREGGESLLAFISGDHMRIFSEVELNLPPKWFTGGEWLDGTAQRFHRQEYKEATAKAERSRKSARTHRDDGKAQPRNFERLAFEDNKGLSPMEICRRAMRRS